jgi:hypothetical protein
MTKRHRRPPDPRTMRIPVRCTHCGAIYDLCGVGILARYADCTDFESPCCHRRVDDREWKSLPDFRRINTESL